MTTLKRIKPGWYLLLLLFLFSIFMTVIYFRMRSENQALKTSILNTPTPQVQASLAPEGLWFPIPGASLPEDDSYLPSSPRIYRRGENQGFDFYGNDSGTPIVFGQSVIASADATVIRADTVFTELSQPDWEALLSKVSDRGANEEDLNLLRGRQVWLELADGRILRYAHLSGIEPDIEVGQQVYRGQVIAAVGNSGTDDGVAGSTRGARLHFEVWFPDGRFFGQSIGSPAAVRDAAQSLFVGP